MNRETQFTLVILKNTFGTIIKKTRLFTFTISLIFDYNASDCSANNNMWVKKIKKIAGDFNGNGNKIMQQRAFRHMG